MARPKSFIKMPLEALVELRNAITSTLNQRTTELQKKLSLVTGGTVDGNVIRPGRSPGRKRGATLKGRKVAPKYRSRKDPRLTWAGRGATPRWMIQEMQAGKLKKEAFLIK